MFFSFYRALWSSVLQMTQTQKSTLAACFLRLRKDFILLKLDYSKFPFFSCGIFKIVLKTLQWFFIIVYFAYAMKHLFLGGKVWWGLSEVYSGHAGCGLQTRFVIQHSAVPLHHEAVCSSTQTYCWYHWTRHQGAPRCSGFMCRLKYFWSPEHFLNMLWILCRYDVNRLLTAGSFICCMGYWMRSISLCLLG